MFSIKSAFILICISSISVLAKVDTHQQDHVIMKDTAKHSEKEHKGSELLEPRKIYQQLLRTKRNEQVNSIKTLLSIDDPKKRKTIVDELVDNLLKVLQTSKSDVQNTKFNATKDTFPSEDNLKENVAKIVENTAFLGDFSLYFPDIVHKILRKNPDILMLIDWCYRFSLELGLYDEVTLKMLNLAGQELELIPREDDFMNPYDPKIMKEQKQREAYEKMKDELAKEHEKKQELKKKKKNKPKISNTEL